MITARNFGTEGDEKNRKSVGVDLDVPKSPVFEVRNGTTKILKKGESPKRGEGSMIVLFSSHNGATAKP